MGADLVGGSTPMPGEDDRSRERPRLLSAWMPAALVLAVVGVWLVVMMQTYSVSFWLGVLWLFVGMPVMATASMIAAVRLRRTPLVSAATIALVVGWYALASSGWIQHRPFNLMHRHDLGRMADEARSTLEDPPADVPTQRDVPFVLTADDGTQVVAWIESSGIPFKSWGIVHDPGGSLARGVIFERSDGMRSVGAGDCSHKQGPWYWCRLY